MNYVIIIAGGVGSRLGANIPKQFVTVLDKPIIAYTMEHFQNHPDIDGIELVCGNFNNHNRLDWHVQQSGR